MAQQMSDRDWFAGMAIQGLLAGKHSGNAAELADMAYGIAEAMTEKQKANRANEDQSPIEADYDPRA